MRAAKFARDVDRDIVDSARTAYIVGRRAPHVHEHDRAGAAPRSGAARGIVSESRNVVDDARAGIERRRHSRGMPRVDRDGDPRVRPGRGPPAGRGSVPHLRGYGLAPGRVLSPPMSTMSAPAEAIASPAAIAVAVQKCRRRR